MSEEINEMEKNKSNKTYILSKISCFAIGNLYNLILSKFPDTVRIETTNACNSLCKICPHSKMKRTIKTMEDGIFKKIIDECAKFNCRRVHLHNFGEPLLDKKIIDRIKYAKNKGLKRIKIFSNGSLLTKDKSIELIKSGLDEIKISFDGATKEEYEQIRYPLKFHKVVNNIKQLVELRDKLTNSTLKIEIACCSTTDKSSTIQLLENCVDKFSFGKVHNWAAAEFDVDKKSKVRKPCTRVWRTFTILSNGDCSLCCLDYDGEIILGNVRESSIAEIWKNQQYKKVRKLHTFADQKQITICDHCTKSYF